MKKSIVQAFVPLAVLAGLSGSVMPALCQWDKNPVPDGQKVVKTPTGLQYYDIEVGKGPSPTSGSNVTVHYTGWLLNKKKFDSSKDHGGQPFTFMLGKGQVIRGWDEGVATMKIGGKRRLVIPSDLAYGPRGMGADIPPNSPLVFDVELLNFR